MPFVRPIVLHWVATCRSCLEESGKKMNVHSKTLFSETSYDRDDCQVGVVHVGFGAFHRAHQAVYIDDFMDASGDLRWGIASVNLRSADTPAFQTAVEDIARHDGYFLKSHSSAGDTELRRVRSHIHFSDWSSAPDEAEALLSLPSVHLVTITVTESGYYTDSVGALNLEDEIIAAEIAGQTKASIYSYLRDGLQCRMTDGGAPITIACCDNIRQNGHMLQRNLLAYLDACGAVDLRDWVAQNAAFPCSMVDRITPRSPAELCTELTERVGGTVASPIMSEDFTQWVLQDSAAADIPDLARVGVTVVNDVDPYEETKIRVLNGGHTALAYMAALEGIETFDAAMRMPALREHFYAFETQEVLPAITTDLPFSKVQYMELVEQRFTNRAIGDTVARICADGMVKFPIFIMPTITGCLRQGVLPTHAIRSIASWHQFACHVAAGNIPFTYVEPSWAQLKPMLGSDDFVTSHLLWGEIPEQYPIFCQTLRQELAETEIKWPV